MCRSWLEVEFIVRSVYGGDAWWLEVAGRPRADVYVLGGRPPRPVIARCPPVWPVRYCGFGAFRLRVYFPGYDILLSPFPRSGEAVSI